MRIAAVVGALVVVVLAVPVALVGAAGGGVARSEADAETALEVARTHFNQTQATLIPPDLEQLLGGATPDFKQAKQQSDDYAARLAQGSTAVNADQLRLTPSRLRLEQEAASPFAAPYAAMWGPERSRVDAIVAALDAARSALQIESGQFATFSAVFDAFVDLQSLDQSLNRLDVAGTLAQLPDFRAKLATAAQLAGRPDQAPVIQTIVADLQQTASDLQAFLVAVQRVDVGAATADHDKLTVDTQNLQAIDTTSIDSFDQALLQPYRDRFEADVRAAGYTTAPG